MKNYRNGLLAITTSFMLAASAFAAEAPPKEKLCQTCHGPGGAKPIAPTYPKLNGQSKGYLIASMKAYRAGQRKGGLAAAMAAQAAGLSDAEIEALAAYYAAVK